MNTLAERVFASSALLLLTRMIQRGIGLVSMLILARLLTPADFGFIAIIYVVIQFFDIVSSVGTEQYIIQKNDVNSEDLNTAWTIKLLTNGLLWLVLILSAPMVAGYFDKPGLDLALYVASLVLLINSFRNPGVILLKKNLIYGKLFRLSVIQKLVAFCVVMVVVIFNPSYWALIGGSLAASITFTVGSYLIHPFRPSPQLCKFNEQFGFSQWMLYRSVFGFTRSQLDTILITKNFSLTDAGAFHLVKTLTYMPANDIVVPAVSPLLAAFSQAKSNTLDLALKFRVGLVVVILLIVPVCVYMILFPELIVDVFLGDQWIRAYTIFPVMAPLLLVLSVSKVYENVCLALGRAKDLFFYNVITTAILFLALVLLLDATLEDFVLGRTLTHLAMVSVFPVYIARFLDIDTPRILLLCIPVLISTVPSALLADWAVEQLSSLAILNLLVTSIIFFTTYIVTIILVFILFFSNAAEIKSVRALLSSLLRRKQSLKSKTCDRNLHG